MNATARFWLATCAGPVLLAAAVLLTPATGQDPQMPFGRPQDETYAKALWSELNRASLIGPNAVHTVPYPGGSPHGAIIETVFSRVRVSGHSGRVIVKHNYGGEGITRSKVANNRNQYLMAITVMFQRESGYDSDNNDWFWAKYLKDGSLDKNPKGVPLAGRVAKGMDQGCIACHKNAGPEMIFLATAAHLDK